MTPLSPSPAHFAPRSLRLWPGLVLAGVIGVTKFVVPWVLPDAQVIGILGGFVGGVLIVAWWLFFSRAPWRERLGAFALFAAALYLSYRFVHESIATGMMGLMLIVHGLPLFALALAVWAVAARNTTGTPRLASLVATPLVVIGLLSLFRTDGIDGDGGSSLTWRWTPTHEQRLLGDGTATSVRPPNGPVTDRALPPPAAPQGKAVSWHGFRGDARDGMVRGTCWETNWNQFPPTPLWRRPVGPAWSSFAVDGEVFYTQEQRGEEEWVTCCNLRTGEVLWHHADATRFWESNAGAGPRATPTLERGRLYTFGGTGILNALNATNGAVLWTREVANETEIKVPMWGFASSPLVVGDLVLVAASGRLAAYEVASGNRRWMAPARGGSYSSPQFAKLHGIDQILMETSVGIASFAPATGDILWEHAWAGSTIIQPATLDTGDLLISTGGPSGGVGMRRLTVSHGTDGWVAQEKWTSNGLKPYFNDFAVHQGHAYGFDGSILACIKLEDGQRQWKEGRYGYGQLVLLADQNLLLVLSERGELVMVEASPGGFRELGKFQAIEGKTWNHPALAGDVVLVRNSEEMAAYLLARLHIPGLDPVGARSQ